MLVFKRIINYYIILLLINCYFLFSKILLISTNFTLKIKNNMNNCYTIVTIKNFPSRNEILLFFNKFIITNKINSDYKIEKTSNCINLKFLE
jgi:hypothetical protein